MKTECIVRWFSLRCPNPTTWVTIAADDWKTNMKTADLMRTVLLLSDGCVWSRCADETQLTPVSIHSVSKQAQLHTLHMSSIKSTTKMMRGVTVSVVEQCSGSLWWNFGRAPSLEMILIIWSTCEFGSVTGWTASVTWCSSSPSIDFSFGYRIMAKEDIMTPDQIRQSTLGHDSCFD